MNQKISASEDRKRSGMLDLLRFLAVTIVFLTHYFDTYNFIYSIVPSNLKYMPVFHYGSTSLCLFFMISGYVVTMTSVKKNIREFIITRLSRIYPLFWVSCLVAFVLPRLIHEHTYLMYSNLRTFAANLTMMPELFGFPWENPVFHTLLIELIFYTFISVVIIFKLWKNILLLITLITLLFLGISLDTTAVGHVFIPPFIGGMIFFFIKAKYAKAWKLHALLFLNYGTTLLAGHIMLGPLNRYYKDPQALNFWTVAVIFTVLYILFYLVVTERVKIRASQLTTRLGELAYPIYLFHIYFMFIYWYFRDMINGELLVTCIFVLTLLVSFLINICIEKPFTKLTAYLMNGLFDFFVKSRSAEQMPKPLTK